MALIDTSRLWYCQKEISAVRVVHDSGLRRYRRALGSVHEPQ
jgi:hypothetical protein